jgi:hypothetical protein
VESSFPGTSVDIIPLASRQNIAAIISDYRVCLYPVDSRPARAHNHGGAVDINIHCEVNAARLDKECVVVDVQ